MPTVRRGDKPRLLANTLLGGVGGLIGNSAATGVLRELLAHERGHIRRRDLLSGWITEAARLEYFFKSVPRWVSFRVCLELEPT
jgi:hypothetical protein